MIPLAVVVLDEFDDGAPKMGLPDRNQPIEAFFLNRPYKPLGVCKLAFGVRIGVTTTQTPASRNTRWTSGLHFESRSQISTYAGPSSPSSACVN